MLNIIVVTNFSSHMACSVAGITSDANVLTNFLRLAAQRLEQLYMHNVYEYVHQISIAISRRDPL